MTMTEQETTTIVDLVGGDARAFGRIIANISKTVSVSRPGVLEGVQIRQDGDTLVFQTTDSYRAITVTMLVDDESTVNIPDPIVVSGKQMVKAAKLVGRKTDHVSMTVAGNYVTVTTADGSANVETYVGTWPAVDNILADAKGYGYPTGADDAGIGVDALLLADTLLVVGKIIGTDQPKINLCGMGSQGVPTRCGPWYWSANNSGLSVDVIIMPLRK